MFSSGREGRGGGEGAERLAAAMRRCSSRAVERGESKDHSVCQVLLTSGLEDESGEDNF